VARPSVPALSPGPAASLQPEGFPGGLV
jgi:hypothetical protein